MKYTLIRQRLGTYLLDLKYKPEDSFLVSKPGADDFVCILANPQMLRDEGIDILAFEKSKTETKCPC